MSPRVAIIGAGIAGASLAAEIAGAARVFILEAEDLPGRHATGRSAAFWSETYGGPLVQPLTSASGQFLRSPPADFYDRPLLGPRGAITLADAAGEPALQRMYHAFEATGVALHWLDRVSLEARLPGLRPGWNSGLAEPECRDIDVAALHGAYLAQARRKGAELIVDARVLTIARREGRWLLDTARGPYDADLIVNAAGAWADDVAAMAGCLPLGIRPYRRTIAQLRIAPSVPSDLPLVLDARERFYFKPEAGGRIWLSPHDETPSPACDCAPEELDIALAIDRLQQVVDWRVDRVERSWAGLRSFAPDRLPVYGFDPGRDDFFWFAGQGGFGIQTAPAAAKLAAWFLLGGDPDPLVRGIDAVPYRADRFAN